MDKVVPKVAEVKELSAVVGSVVLTLSMVGGPTLISSSSWQEPNPIAKVKMEATIRE
jgi:hypothetical protein